MKYFYILGLIFVQLSLSSQIQRDPKAIYKPPEFLTNAPLWHYTVYDSTNIGFPIERLSGRLTDGYNTITYIRPWNWKPIFEGEYMYAYSTSFGTTSHIFGALIYRINITNGKLNWLTAFDNRHSDRQEYVQSIQLNGDTLEVVTMRRYDTHVNDLIPFTYNTFGADSYVCTRKYNKTTGELLNYICWDKEDPNIMIVAPHSEGSRIFEKKTDNTYILLNSKILSSKHIEFYSIGNKGTLNYIRKDTLYYPKENYNDFSKLQLSTPGGKMTFLENDSILVGYNYNYFDGINRSLRPDLCYIQLYNKRLEPTGRIHTGKFVNMYDDVNDISIRYANPKFIVLHVNRTNTSNIVVIDFDANILSNVEYKRGNNEFSMFGGTGYLPYSKKSFMVTKTYGPQNPPEIPQTLKYYIFENEEWVLKFSQDMGENHYIDEIKYFTETPNHDIIMCADHAYYNEDKDLSCYETDMWMLIDGTKLGIKTGNSEHHPKSIVKVYPNPAYDILNIETDFPINSIELLDINGKQIHLYKEINFLNSIDISDFQPGVFILTIRNSKNEVVNRSKVVKIKNRY
jgi:hypothetical protein